MDEEKVVSVETDENLKDLKISELVKKRKNFNLILAIILSVVLFFSMATVIYRMADKNSYDITANGGIKGDLALSFEENFQNGFTTVKGLGVDKMEKDGGGTYSDIEGYVDGVISGEIGMTVTDGGKAGRAKKSGSDEYTVSKLYLKNLNKNDETIKYKININIKNESRNSLYAARFMICRVESDKTYKQVFAVPKEDGTPEELAKTLRGSEDFIQNELGGTWLCEKLYKNEKNEWFYDSLLNSDVTYSLEANKTVCYVIAVWYEGSDPDHNDNISGGSFSFEINFETILDA